MSLVRIVNTSDDKTYTLHHDRHGDSVIAPGRTAIVDLEVALVHLGNTGLENRSASERWRDAEVTRVQTMWGYYKGLHSDSAWNGVGIDNLIKPEHPNHKVGPFRPQLEVYDVEDPPNRMWFIHDDPSGANRSAVLADHIADVSSGRAIDAEIRALNDQIRHLTDIATAQQAALATLGVGSGPPEPGTTEAALAAAMDTDVQGDRNVQRFDIPKPAEPDGPVPKDRPRTPRVGSRVAAG